MAIAGGIRRRRSRSRGVHDRGDAVAVRRDIGGGSARTRYGLHHGRGAWLLVGRMSRILEVGVWDRSSILENVPWHRHIGGSCAITMGGRVLMKRGKV